MPKAAMNQNNLLMSRQNYVWLSGQMPGVKSKSKTEFMNDGAHNKFRLRVARTNI